MKMAEYWRIGKVQVLQAVARRWAADLVISPTGFHIPAQGRAQRPRREAPPWVRYRHETSPVKGDTFGHRRRALSDEFLSQRSSHRRILSQHHCRELFRPSQG